MTGESISLSDRRDQARLLSSILFNALGKPERHNNPGTFQQWIIEMQQVLQEHKFDYVKSVLVWALNDAWWTRFIRRASDFAKKIDEICDDYDAELRSNKIKSQEGRVLTLEERKRNKFTRYCPHSHYVSPPSCPKCLYAVGLENEEPEVSVHIYLQHINGPRTHMAH